MFIFTNLHTVAEFSLMNSVPLGPSILARLAMTRQFGEPSETKISKSFSPRQTDTQRQVNNPKKPSQALTHHQVYRNRTSKFPTGARLDGILCFFQKQC
jgi:hypothetical protein